MIFKSITTNLLVDNVTETIEYYKNKLGFSVLKTIPEQGDFDWALVKRNDVVIMFQSRRSLSNNLAQESGKKPGSGLTLYIYVQGIREIYLALEDEVEIISSIESTFYNTIEFSILDLNGYVITFAENNNEPS